MSYEAKFGFQPGNNLVFTAFQPSGVGRGLAYQFLQEVVNHGYYRATPLTNLVVGDMVLVYKQEEVLHTAIQTVYLDYEYVFWEGKYVFCGGSYVKDYDTTANQEVFWTEKVIGTGEYESVIDFSTRITDINNNQNIVTNIYDEREVAATGGQAIASTGQLIVEGGDC